MAIVDGPVEQLPNELLALILNHAPDIVWPFAALVNRRWYATIGHIVCRTKGPDVKATGDILSMCLARMGHWHLIDWATRHLVRPRDPFRACAIMAAIGSIAGIQWMRERGHAWNGTAYAAAIRHGRFAHAEQLRALGCPGEQAVCVEAARTGTVPIIEWAHRSGFTVSPNVTIEAARNGHTHVLDWLEARGLFTAERVSVEAALNGHLCVIRWLLWHDLVIDKAACVEAAARRGHMPIIAWACDRKFPVTAQVSVEAARGGHLPIVMWAEEKGLLNIDGIVEKAARRGHLHILAWVHNRHFWNADICARAARGGHLNIIVWAHDHGYMVDDATWCEAEARGHVRILEWLRAHGFCTMST